MSKTEKLLPFISFAWGSSDSARGDHTFNGNVTWLYPSTSGHFTSVSKEIMFDWFLWFIASKWVISWIYYTLLMFCDWTQQVKVITSVSYGCHISFEFTCEILINKFEVHIFHVHLWDLIKHLAIPLCINISIWSYKFCFGIPRFCKVIKKHVLLTLRYQTHSQHPSSHPRSSVQRNIPSWCWNINIDWKVNFAVSNWPNLTL